MSNRKFVIILSKCVLRFCTIFGFCPFQFNSKKFIFEINFFYYFYSILFYLVFAYLYLTSGLTIILKLNPLAMISFVYLSIMAITVTFIAQWFNAPGLVRIFNNEKLFLFELFSACGYSKLFRESLLMILCKTLIVSAIAQIAVINGCIILGKLVTGHVDYLVIFIVSVAYFLQTLVPNIFYVTVLTSTFFYRQMNENILSFAKENDRKLISEKINRLAALHFRLTKVLNKINSVLSIQLLASTADFVAILIIEVKSY